MKKLLLYYHTLKYIKPEQGYYQIYYRVRNKILKHNPALKAPDSFKVHLNQMIPAQPSFKRNEFRFLNITHSFSDIDWNFSGYGKLWTYNLNYFDYLNQEDITEDEGVRLIRDFCSSKGSHKDGNEPYPISLRIINWVKFLSRTGIISDDEVNRQLYSDCIRLSHNLEYHLLGNHLLENGFGLLFGAYYFRDEKLYTKAEEIIKSQLKEQILSDGAHFELSPMYHQIILSRVLDAYNLVTFNEWKRERLGLILKTTSEKMLSWLEWISFRNGEIPMVNDAAKNIAPTTTELVEYAGTLGIESVKLPIGSSGYRKYLNRDFEVLFDAGQIAPAYQPGHSHADNLNFILNFRNAPIIVDTGVSTYEKNERRLLERSTRSHNTVVINEESSSKVWSGFRVAERAETKIIEEASENTIVASHNGYRKLGVTHQRRLELFDGSLLITDELIGDLVKSSCEGHLHFHPDTRVEKAGNGCKINDDLLLIIEGASAIRETEYLFASGFNQLNPARKIIYTFSGRQVKIEFRLKNDSFID